MTAFAPPSPGHCKIKMSALLDTGFPTAHSRFVDASSDPPEQRNRVPCASFALARIQPEDMAETASLPTRVFGGRDVLFGRVSHAVACFRIFDCGAGERSELDQRRQDKSRKVRRSVR